MGQQETVATSLAHTVREGIGAALAQVDADLARRYPGDPGTRQPVHTVYVPGDAFTAGTLRSWGDQALAALDEHAPDAGALATVLGIPEDLAGPVYDRVRAKLEREPIEDLRIDFEDGYGPRPDAEEDEAAARAAALVAAAFRDGTAAPYMGIRMKCMEAAVRDRGIRTLDIFLTGLMEAGGLPDGLVLDAPQGDLRRAGHGHGPAAGGLREGPWPGERPDRLRDPDRDHPVDPGRRRPRHRRPDDRGRRGPRHVPALRHLRLQRLLRRQRRPPVARPPGRRPRQGRHAGGRRGHRRPRSPTAPPMCCRSAPPTQVHDAWRLHHGLVRRSLARAYYQGWDMHPGHLPTRYAAVYAFYREGLEQASARLAAYVAEAGGDVMDEPATAKALSGYLLRGLDCGAVDTAEVARLTGLTRADLDALAGRPAKTA